MGFEREKAEEALKETGFDENAAIEKILGN